MSRADLKPSSLGAKCTLELSGIRHGIDGLRVVEQVSFRVATGEIVALLAPSGAGKTTLLRLALGAIKPDSGRVDLSTDSGQVALIPQVDAVFPWLTVEENLGFLARFGNQQVSGEEMFEVLTQYELTEFAKHYPRSLSGGMTQLVAICRLFLANPQLAVLDEALAHVDELRKTRVMAELRRRVLADQLGVLLITQNPAEALYLADRVLIGSRRPLTIVREFSEPLPRHREAEIVHSDDFGRSLARLRQCLHEHWT